MQCGEEETGRGEGKVPRGRVGRRGRAPLGRTPKGAVVPEVAGDKPEDAYGIRDEGWSGEIGREKEAPRGRARCPKCKAAGA